MSLQQPKTLIKMNKTIAKMDILVKLNGLEKLWILVMSNVAMVVQLQQFFDKFCLF